MYIIHNKNVILTVICLNIVKVRYNMNVELHHSTSHVAAYTVFIAKLAIKADPEITRA